MKEIKLIKNGLEFGELNFKVAVNRGQCFWKLIKVSRIF